MDKAWLDSNVEGSPAVFGDEDRAPYAFILAHFAKHRKTPPLAIFEKSYPAKAYKLKDSGATGAELAEQVRNEIVRAVTEHAIDLIASMHDTGDWDGPLEVLRTTARRLEAGGSVSDELTEIGFGDLDGLPDPVPQIDGILDLGTVTLLSGPSGKGKSFIALDWALSVNTGLAWFGHEATQGNVLYVAAEGAHGQKRRVQAWKQVQDEEPQGRLIIRPANLGNPVHVDELCASVRAGDHRLVVLDTLAKCTAGMDENSAQDMGVAIAAAYRLRDAIEENYTTVLIVHHTGYNTGRARGSSAIAAGVDNVFDVNAYDPHDAITLSCSKRKDGEPPADMSLYLEQVALLGGGTSCVVEQRWPEHTPGEGTATWQGGREPY